MNRNFRKKVVFNFSLFVLLSALLISVLPHSTYAADDFTVEAKAALAIDAASGKVLFNQNGDTSLPIASMTKMITAYLVLEAVAQKKISWDDSVPISQSVAYVSQDMNLSNVAFNTTATYTVKDLFDATVIASANGAAIALGEKVAGSNQAFIDLMRSKLESWGIKDAHIISACGLNNSDISQDDLIYPDTKEDDENQMSAKDVATVAFHLLKDYPEIIEVTQTTEKTFKEGTYGQVEMTNWNWMLPGFNSFKEGVDGLKTGTTDLAGACFTGTIVKDKQRIITVVMNATNADTDSAARFTETGKLMDHVFDVWKKEIILKIGTPIDPSALPVSQGKQLDVGIALAHDVSAWVRKDMNPESLTIKFTANEPLLDKDKKLVAPIKKDLAVGTATVFLTDDTLGYIPDQEATQNKIVTTKAVDKANFFVLAGRSVKTFFSNLF